MSLAARPICLIGSCLAWQIHCFAQTTPNPDCKLDELKQQLKTAQQHEAESKKEMKDRQGPLLAEEADMNRALKQLEEELPSPRADGNITSAFDIDRAIKKYEAALSSYNGAVDHFMDIVTTENYEKARAELEAAEAPRKKARDELLALADAAIQYEKKRETEREKEIQAALAKKSTPNPAKELQTLYPKKGQPAAVRQPGSTLEDLPGSEVPQSKLQRLQEARDFFRGMEPNYDEASGEFASGYADYKKAYQQRAALQEKINQTEERCACPNGTIDSCLIGTWECVSFKENIKSYTGGGTGFRLTFASDCTETVDYGPMKPIMAGRDTVSYLGTASAKISTKNSVGKIEKMVNAGASLNAVAREVGLDWKPKIAGLGAGGLGSVKGGSKYTCTEYTLEFQTSTAADQHPNCSVKLHRVEAIR